MPARVVGWGWFLSCVLWVVVVGGVRVWSWGVVVECVVVLAVRRGVAWFVVWGVGSWWWRFRAASTP